MGKRGLRAASWLPLLLKTVRHDSRSRFVRPRHSVSQPASHSFTHSLIHSLTHSFIQPASQWNEQKKCKNAQTTIRFHGWFNRVWVWFGLAWFGSGWDGIVPRQRLKLNPGTELRTGMANRSGWDGTHPCGEPTNKLRDLICQGTAKNTLWLIWYFIYITKIKKIYCILLYCNFHLWH